MKRSRFSNKTLFAMIAVAAITIALVQTPYQNAQAAINFIEQKQSHQQDLTPEGRLDNDVKSFLDERITGGKDSDLAGYMTSFSAEMLPRNLWDLILVRQPFAIKYEYLENNYMTSCCITYHVGFSNFKRVDKVEKLQQELGCF